MIKLNLYIKLINNVIDYIEENALERLTLAHISRQFNLSDYHFNRLFKAIVGTSLKQYVLGRKLTLTLDRLQTTNDAIIDIAMDYGFEYPEVFSRAFKKQFGVSPRTYRIAKYNGPRKCDTIWQGISDTNLEVN